MSTEPKNTGKRIHKATYARDKKTGGYLIRVIGPHATEFAGRTVPVTKMDGDESQETLTTLVWSGTDKGFDDRPGTGHPAALYKFEPKPREHTSVEF